MTVFLQWLAELPLSSRRLERDLERDLLYHLTTGIGWAEIVAMARPLRIQYPQRVHTSSANVANPSSSTEVGLPPYRLRLRTSQPGARTASGPTTPGSASISSSDWNNAEARVNPGPMGRPPARLAGGRGRFGPDASPNDLVAPASPTNRRASATKPMNTWPNGLGKIG